ncbi:MAG: hypothetical protein RL272_90 [Candidatus Parcubacteria bacterium]|jgi:type IV secretory pathway VirB10-like protein
MLEYQGEVREGRVGKPLEPFLIVVKDDTGNPLPHHPLEFMIVEGKGSFTHADSATDQTGSAIAEFVPEDSGRFRVECRIGPEQREIASFKGLVEDRAPKRKQRSRSTRTSAAAKRQTGASRPAIPPPPPVPTVETPKVAEAPPAPPPPATASVAPTAPAPPPAATAPASKPIPPRIAARVPTAAKAATTTHTAVRERPAAATPKRRQTASRMSPAVRWLLIAVVTVAALLAPLAGILVAQELSRPKAAAASRMQQPGHAPTAPKRIAPAQ